MTTMPDMLITLLLGHPYDAWYAALETLGAVLLFGLMLAGRRPVVRRA